MIKDKQLRIDREAESEKAKLNMFSTQSHLSPGILSVLEVTFKLFVNAKCFQMDVVSLHLMVGCSSEPHLDQINATIISLQYVQWGRFFSKWVAQVDLQGAY